MNFKISVILLHLFTTTLPISQHSLNSRSVLATAIDTNDTQAKIRGLSPTVTTTATILSETCNDRFCYNFVNETKTKTNGSETSSTLPSISTQIYKHYDWLMGSSVLYGVLKVASEKEQSNTCFKELNQVYEGIHRKEIWAMKALDSSGTPEPGFVLGHNFWLGSMKGCEAVRKPHTLTISNRFQRHMHSDLVYARAPINVDYRMVYATHQSPWQIQVEFVLEKTKVLHIGLCLPTSCSNEEIANLTQDYFNLAVLDAQLINDYHPKVLKAKDLYIKTDFLGKSSFQLISICIIFTILMMIIAHTKEDTATTTGNTSTVVALVEANAKSSELTPANQPDVVLQCRKLADVQQKTFFDSLAECYSTRKNLDMLFSVKTSSNAVPIIDGLRSIGCFLILLFHMNWYIHYTVHNTTMMFAYGEQTLWQWVSATPIIVDVFFTISGLLLSYNFLRNQPKLEQIRSNTLKDNIILFCKQLLNRYIRLTPMYLIVVGMMEIITAYMVDTSPFWIHDRYDITCDKYWWRNVLYIQNLFHVDDLCVTWSWSLACEMQFFILFTALLFLYAKYPNVAKAIFCSLFGIFSTLIFAIAMFTKFTPAYDVMHSLGNDLYVSPWTRILPYLVGVAAGYVMYTINGVMPLGEKTVKILWAVTTTLAVGSHISTMYRNISHFIAAPLITAIRIFYSTSVAWMIVASQTGHGGRFAKILNYPVFVHINKLSYAIYLLNPALITVIYGIKDHSTHVDPITMIVMSVGVMVIVYIAAIMFSVMFEIPYTSLSSKLLKQSTQKSRKSSSTSSLLASKVEKIH